MDLQDVLDDQFDRGWDSGVQYAFDIVCVVLGPAPALDEIRRRFIHELEMKGDE